MKKARKPRVPTELEKREGLSFNHAGHLEYHPDFHFAHDEPFSLSDLIYLCKYHKDGPKSISLALGRVEQVVVNKLRHLQREGLYEIFRKLPDELWEIIIIHDEQREAGEQERGATGQSCPEAESQAKDEDGEAARGDIGEGCQAS